MTVAEKAAAVVVEGTGAAIEAAATVAMALADSSSNKGGRQ